MAIDKRTLIPSEGWTATMLSYIDKLPNIFKLSDIYTFETHLKERFPNNNHIRWGIARTLKFLEKKDIILKTKNKGEYKNLGGKIKWNGK